MSFKSQSADLDEKSLKSHFDVLDFDIDLWSFYCPDLEFKSDLWEYMLNSLTAAEKQKVMRYHFDEDKKKSLISRYLQRAMIRDHFNLSDDELYRILSSAKVSGNKLIYISILIPSHMSVGKAIYAFEPLERRGLQLQRLPSRRLCVHRMSPNPFGNHLISTNPNLLFSVY